MGFSEDRIEHRPEGWLGSDPNVVDVNCAICMEVLEEPLMVPDCEHTFCRRCIEGALQNSTTNDQKCCPQCRTKVPTPHAEQLKPAPRLLRNILGQLKVKCRFAPAGCTAPAMSPGDLRTHEVACSADPDATQICRRGCGLLLSNRELAGHDCLKAAVAEIERLGWLYNHQLDKSKALCILINLRMCFKNLSQRPVEASEGTPQFVVYDHVWDIMCRRLDGERLKFSLNCYGPLDRRAAAAAAGVAVSAAHRWRLQLDGGEVKLRLKSTSQEVSDREEIVPRHTMWSQSNSAAAEIVINLNELTAYLDPDGKITVDAEFPNFVQKRTSYE